MSWFNVNKKVYIGFSKPRGFFKPFSWAIRLWEGTEYSHVYIRIPSRFLGMDLIYQASGSSVNMFSFERFVEQAIIIEEHEFELTEGVERCFLSNCMSKLGAPYSVRQVLGIALNRLQQILKLPNYRWLADGRSAYVCSELAGEILVQYLGVDIKEELDLLTPKDIYEIVVSLRKGIK